MYVVDFREVDFTNMIKYNHRRMKVEYLAKF